MSPDPITITPQTPVEEAATIMYEGQIGGVPVMEAGKLVGIITRTDLLKLLVKMLKEKNRGDLK
jgi:acetoin utilization protein AcuB